MDFQLKEAYTMSRKSEQLRRQERMEILLLTLLDYYLTSKQLKGCSPKTIAAMRSVLSRFIRFLEARGHSLKLIDLTLQDARDFSASLNGKIVKYEGHKFNRPVPDAQYSPETIHSYVRILRTFSSWLYEEGYTKRPLLDRLELPKLPKPHVEVLTPEEIKKIIAIINPDTYLGSRLLAMILIMLDTGIRAGELVGMLMRNVDWERGVIKVLGKGSKERIVPIGIVARQTMLRYVDAFRPKPAREDVDNVFLSVDGYPLTVNAIVHIMSRLAKNSGVTRLHAHLWRHTSSVTYLLDGGDMKSLQLYLGHSTTKMTGRYLQFTEEQRIAQNRKHSPADSLGLSYRRFGKGRRLSSERTGESTRTTRNAQ